MKTAPRMVLRDLLRDLGRDLVTDPELTGRLLIERCPDCQAEITLLLQAQRYGVPQSLNTGDVLHPMATVIQRLALDLQAHYFTPTAANWAVETWALALELEMPESTANVERRISPTDGKEQVWIPEGEFLFGNDNRKLTLPGFWIDVTPVTQAEYHRFLQANPSLSVPYDLEDWGRPYNWDKYQRTPPAGKERHPVTLITWHNAVAYAEWANKRLPTVEEWVKAARGTDGREYPWGNEFDVNKCNTKEGRTGGTTPVGKYSPLGDSPYGCVDMAGNVWEWTATQKPAEGREAAIVSSSRGYGWDADYGDRRGFGRMFAIMCGGYWADSGKSARVTQGREAERLFLYGGFRCVG